MTERLDLVPKSAARRVLIVEDDRRLREMLVASMADMGLTPTAAPSAEAAMKIVADGQPFAVAVIDLNLPGMDGLGLCERLRRERHPAELVILTGFGDLDAARRAIRLEVVDFLTKPCAMDDLEHALSRARLRWLDRWFHDAALPPVPPPAPPPPPSAADATQASIDDAERKLILAALARHNGNRELAAAEVGLSVRTVYYRLKQYQQLGHAPDPA